MSLPHDNPVLAWSMLKPSQNKRRVNILHPDIEESKNYIKLVLLSDTHNRHSKFTVPDGDILLHCGDFTFYGEQRKDIRAFDKYMGTLSHSRKILIAGNHDWDIFNTYLKSPYKFENCEYLQDSFTMAFGYKIYGSPWVPHHHYGAFMLNRGTQLKEIWKLIPDDTDVLMTHGPPLGYGDSSISKNHAGDVDLLLEVQNRVKPIVHVFGHIHEDRGSWTDGTTTFINASICDVHYRATNEPIVLYLPVRERVPNEPKSS